MHFFSNLRIGRRLSVAFGFVLALLIAVAGMATWELGYINDNVVNLADNTVPSFRMVRSMSSQLAKLESLSMQHMRAAKPEDLADIDKRIASTRSELLKSLQGYSALVSDEQDRQNLDATQKAANAYLAVSERIWKMTRDSLQNADAGDTADQAIQLNDQGRQALASATASVDTLWTYNEQLGDAAAQEAKGAYANSLRMLGGMTLLAIAIGAVLATVIARSIAKPLHEAVAVARAVADGDMTRPIHAQGQDETAQLLQALADMQSGLARVIGTVRQGADGVATASAQIAQGNGDLSQRTEEQASAIEETAASMEELGATVKHNADNAHQADQLAQSATNVARQGGEVVAQVVETMRGINDSSKKISDIIAVIDGIAFQTNILALNAAVEAARAGEQGRGFAVVATEVRNLAQRSADAAKEIKTLITASVERVEQGTALVDRAGETIQAVVTSIADLSGVVGEISAASREQSSGVAQVGEAISQMDQTTQQNAALVEESAAAAESLRQQAQQLAAAVAVFKLSTAESATPIAKPVAPVTAPNAAAGNSWGGTERRGPNRAQNVTRPNFSASATKPAAPKAAPPVHTPREEAAPLARTGTDDDWTTF